MPHIPIYASSNFEGISKRGLYGDVVSELDWSAGEILKTLRDLKLDKNTLVIFTSDNGPWLVQKENGGSAGSLKGVQIQKMPANEEKWGNKAQLRWVNAQPEDKLELDLISKKSGKFELLGFFTRAKDYGIFQVYVNGKPVGDLIDGYAKSIEPTGPVSLGNVNFKKGSNDLVIKLIGKDVRATGFSNGYLVGVDRFLIKD